MIEFQLKGHTWATERMHWQRGGLTGELYGATHPLWETTYSRHEQTRIRAAVAEDCRSQVTARRPYNWRSQDSEREDAFYCSQLAYKAYQPFDVTSTPNAGCQTARCRAAQPTRRRCGAGVRAAGRRV